MECIRPIDEALGLDDCLACSGCVAIKEPNAEKHLLGLEKIQGKEKIGVVITPQSKIALYERTKKKSDFSTFENKLLFFLRRHEVIDSSFGSRVLLEREMQKKGTTISSMCPGVVAYAEGSAHHLLPYLSQTLSPIEICASVLKKKSLSVLSIVMCKDKRVEAEKNSLIDYCITTNEFYDAFSDKLEEPSMFEPSPLSISCTLPGLSSGGIFEGILSAIPESSILSKKEKDNYKEISFMQNGQVRKIAQVHGLPRVISFSTQAKSLSFLNNFLYVEIMICRKGCLYGPSQGIVSSFSAYSYTTVKNTGHSLNIPKEEMLEKAFSAKKKSRVSFAIQW